MKAQSLQPTGLCGQWGMCAASNSRDQLSDLASDYSPAVAVVHSVTLLGESL